MVWTVLRSVSFLCCVSWLAASPAQAHVKWFLTSTEADLLRQPKPDLFVAPSIWNMVPLFIALYLIIATTIFGREWTRVLLNRKLVEFSERKESYINLFIRLCAGISIVHSASLSQLFAPNFVICLHCPQWLPLAEFLVGYSLMMGIWIRTFSIVFLGLLAFTFLKHPLADCLDLIPLYGVAIYCLISGSNRFSLDYVLGAKHLPGRMIQNIAHLAIRWGMGLGLMILALDEKLLNPQLAINVLQSVPRLNFMHSFGLGNDLFILCAGLVELTFGIMLVVGSLPRLAIILLSVTMFATTTLFGKAELFGHAPYYGIALSIVLRGSGSLPLIDMIKRAMISIPLKQRQSASVELVSQRL